MVPPFNDIHKELLDRVVQALELSGRLNDVALDYIDAALFPPEADRLALFLKAGTDSQWESFLDLVFYPDQTLQVELEPLLQIAPCSVDDETAILGCLLAQEIVAPVSMPDGTDLAAIRLPDFVKSHFLERLNLSWQIDFRLAEAIDTWVAAGLGPVVRVRLRNAGIQLDSAQLAFLGRFFERMAARDPDYLACLDLVLSFLTTSDSGADMYAVLVAGKRTLFRSLQQAQRIERRLRQSTMETLMLQGVRIPPLAPERLWQHMRLIDRVCLAVFGKTEAIELPLDAPLREVSSLETPAAIIRSLLG